MLAPWKKAMTNLDSLLKKQRHHFADKDQSRQSYGFPNSHLQMWELNHKESWALNNRCFQTVVKDKTLEKSPLDIKEIKPVHPKGNQLWIFIGSADTEAETQILWPPDAKSWLTGKDWCWEKWMQKEKGATEDEMVGWHITNSMDMSLSQLWKIVKDRKVWHAAVHGVTKSQTWQSYWTTT